MRLGAQLYTVRTYIQNERDFRESMRRVAAIGYRDVQISGAGRIDPRTMRAICDEYGLKIGLTHTDPERILNDVEGVIAEHDALGCDYVGIGGMPERYRSAAWVERFAEDFTRPAERLHAAGKRLMYHNHNFEWERMPDGRRMIDVLLASMPAELMGITLDTYWVQAAGADVLAFIDRVQDRIPCVHLKDMAVKGFEQRFAPVGEGNIDFARVLARLQQIGKTQYMYVEQDASYGEDPFDCLRRSYDNVRAMGY